MSSDSAEIKLFNEWNSGFQLRDINIIEKHLHEDFRRHTYPRSLNVPEQNKKEWIEHFKGVISFSTGFESELHSIIEAPGKLVVHMTNEAANPLGVNVKRESIFILHTAPDETGTLKIKQVDEFTDSKTYLEVIRAVSEAKAGRK